MPNLSDPLCLGRLRLANRLVMAPMVTGMAEGAAPAEAMLAWYRDHARSGVGLLVVEATAVSPDATLTPRALGAWEDGQVKGLARLAEAIHGEGVPALVQLVHGGARAFRENGAERVGPSAVALVAGPTPRAMNEGEILQTIEAFAAAARRIQAAGFDGVELHAAHYYLLSQFLSPRTNLRTDRWGGDREGRARLLREVLQSVRSAVGPSFLISCRLHATEAVEGGLSEADAAWTAQRLAEEGLDLLNASAVGQSSLGEWEGQPFLSTSSVPPKGSPGGAYAEATGRLKAAVPLPVVAVGKLSEPGAAQAVLDRGQADLIALARPLLADPRAAAKLLAGQDEAIDRCRECLACFAAIRTGALRCSVNSALNGSGRRLQEAP